MIRTQPKTTDGLAFDPVASALTACSPILHSLGALRVRYDTGLSVGSYPCDGSYSATVSPEEAKSLMERDQFEVLIEIDTLERTTELKIVVINDLICVPDTALSVDGATNGDFGRTEVCYPEALDPAKSRGQFTIDSVAKDLRACGGRPYYAVVCDKFDGAVFICHGPDNSPRCGRYIFTDKGDYGRIDVYSTKELVGATTDTPVTEVGELVPPRGNGGASFRTPDGLLFPVVLTQAAQFVDGRSLNNVDFLKSLQIVCLWEENPDNIDLSMFMGDLIVDGALQLPVHLTGGIWYLDEIATSIWAELCAENAWVRSLFSNLRASLDEMYIVDNGGNYAGSVTKRQDSQSCYALSYAYIMALVSGGGLADAIASIQSCVEPWSGITTDGKYIVADQKKWGSFTIRTAKGTALKIHKSGYGAKGTGSKRGQTYVSGFSVKQLCEEVGEGGVFILGYDPDSSKPANGYSDHFIVVRVTDSRLIVEFDPYRVEGSVTYNAPGTDVTPMADSFHEACVHIFKVVENDA